MNIDQGRIRNGIHSKHAISRAQLVDLRCLEIGRSMGYLVGEFCWTSFNTTHMLAGSFLMIHGRHMQSRLMCSRLSLNMKVSNLDKEIS